MTDWTAFVGVTGVVLVLLLALARASQGTVSDNAARASVVHDTSPADDERPGERESTDTFSAHEETGAGDSNDDLASETTDPEYDPITGVQLSGRRISTGVLLANVALSQGLFAVVLIGAAWYTSVPAAALGVDFSDPLSVGLPALAIGIAVGIALYAANALGAALASALGFDHEERLRDLLTPETTTGWVLLLGGVLPVIAGFEELLFRGALIGVPSTAFGISPWFLAGASSAAFAFGHGAQGRLGILVTGVLGFALAAVFILTHSLLAVIVAHYLVNAFEFIIGGAFGIEWG